MEDYEKLQHVLLFVLSIPIAFIAATCVSVIIYFLLSKTGE